jgi:DNA-3-methyladenine glycosylase
MQTADPLPRSFYVPAADIVAPKLLGHLLLRRAKTGWVGGPIVETEAYLFEDPASHSYVGETARNRSMYGPPGHAYVYFIYGNHYCVNAVTCPKGVGEAVLIRGIEPQIALEIMRANRAVSKEVDLTNGPAKLCAALDIERDLDGADLCDTKSALIIARNPQLKKFLKERGPVTRTTRIGITKGAESLLRFYLDGSPCVSRRGKVAIREQTTPP